MPTYSYTVVKNSVKSDHFDLRDTSNGPALRTYSNFNTALDVAELLNKETDKHFDKGTSKGIRIGFLYTVLAILAGLVIGKIVL